MTLADSERRAIKHGGYSLQLVACAGSGKTEVLATGAVQLPTPRRADSLASRDVIAITFTDQAAAELKERITMRTRLALNDVAGLAAMFAGIHAAFWFSELRYFSARPSQFEARGLGGFKAPIPEALGYGKLPHDPLAAMHARAIYGDVANAAEVPRQGATHRHAPYAYPALRHPLEAPAEGVLRGYPDDDGALGFIAYAKASPQRAAAALRAGALAAAPAATKRAACKDRGMWTTRRRAGGGH